jgi:hypothetical protein
MNCYRRKYPMLAEVQPILIMYSILFDKLYHQMLCADPCIKTTWNIERQVYPNKAILARIRVEWIAPEEFSDRVVEVIRSAWRRHADIAWCTRPCKVRSHEWRGAKGMIGRWIWYITNCACIYASNWVPMPRNMASTGTSVESLKLNELYKISKCQSL